MDGDRATEIEMIVESVRVHPPSDRHVVVLREVGRGRLLLIWVGPWEASAIAMKLQGMTPERPLTHDLLAGVIEELGARVERIVISDLAEDTFHARIVVREPDAVHDIDARPSDAVALALRVSAPIFATPDVLDRAAMSPDEDEERDDEAGAAEPGRRLRRAPGAALEETGEPIDATRLDIFRRFVNSLDVEGDQRGGSSS